MRVRAAVLAQAGRSAPYAQSRPLSVQDVELQAPGSGEITVKIEAAGVCHSDLSAVTGARPWPMPLVLGHEAAGEVVALGAGVADLCEGDHVVMVFRPSCGACLECATGRPALCRPGGAANSAGELLGGGRRLRAVDDESGVDEQRNGIIHHHLGCSAFAEYATVSRRSVVKVDASLPWQIAALFGCAVLTGAGAVFNTAGFVAGSSAVIVGLGGVGMAALLAAQASGAGEIVVIDMHAAKLDLARSLGVRHCLSADAPQLREYVQDVTHGGADYAFETAGHVSALALSHELVRPGGTTVTTGLPHPAHRWELPAAQLTAQERVIKGSYMGSCVPMRDVPRFISMYQAGRLAVDRLLGSCIRLDEVNAALDLVASGAARRQIITMS